MVLFVEVHHRHLDFLNHNLYTYIVERIIPTLFQDGDIPAKVIGEVEHIVLKSGTIIHA